MSVKFSFDILGDDTPNLTDETATLFELTHQILPGTSTPITKLTQLAETKIANDQVTFDFPISNRYMLRVGSSTIIFRSDKLADDDFDVNEQQPDLGEKLIRLYGTAAIRMTLDELQANLPALPLFEAVNNADPVTAIRIDTMQLKQVGQAFEITGAGNMLSFYDPDTGVVTEYSDFTYLYRFTLKIFTGLPASNRIINVESSEAIITAQGGIGTTLKAMVINAILNTNNDQVVSKIEQTVQARLDANIQVQTGGLSPRTVTLSTLEIVQGKDYVLETTGWAWIAAAPGQGSRLGCRELTARMLTQAVSPSGILRRLRRKRANGVVRE